MKNPAKLLAVCMVFVFCLIGCGGSGSSSTAETLSSTSSSEQLPQSTPSEQFSSLEINPLADLGMVVGNKVCFSVKAYDNFSESDYSEAVCGQIEDDNKVILSWNKITESNVNGYYVYFGTNENNATTFLADVIES